MVWSFAWIAAPVGVTGGTHAKATDTLEGLLHDLLLVNKKRNIGSAFRCATSFDQFAPSPSTILLPCASSASRTCGRPRAASAFLVTVDQPGIIGVDGEELGAKDNGVVQQDVLLEPTKPPFQEAMNNRKKDLLEWVDYGSFQPACDRLGRLPHPLAKRNGKDCHFWDACITALPDDFYEQTDWKSCIRGDINICKRFAGRPFCVPQDILGRYGGPIEVACNRSGRGVLFGPLDRSPRNEEPDVDEEPSANSGSADMAEGSNGSKAPSHVEATMKDGTHRDGASRPPKVISVEEALKGMDLARKGSIGPKSSDTDAQHRLGKEARSSTKHFRPRKNTTGCWWMARDATLWENSRALSRLPGQILREGAPERGWFVNKGRNGVKPLTRAQAREWIRRGVLLSEKDASAPYKLRTTTD